MICLRPNSLLKVLSLKSVLHRNLRIMSSKPIVVFVLGGPGAGKGTQCDLICKEFGFTHLSAGDLLRAERNTEGSKFGELIEHHIKNGTIVPVEITCKLLEKAMNAIQLNGSGDPMLSRGKFLIDGFPRNQNNLEGWQKEMQTKVDLRFVLFFDCPRDICVDRCLKRGQAGSGRSDDNVESLNKRINTYLYDTMPIIQYYDRLKLVRKVDAALPPEQVFDSVRHLFQQISD